MLVEARQAIQGAALPVHMTTFQCQGIFLVFSLRIVEALSHKCEYRWIFFGSGLRDAPQIRHYSDEGTWCHAQS